MLVAMRVFCVIFRSSAHSMKSSSVDEENLPGNPFGGGFGSQARGTRSEDRN